MTARPCVVLLAATIASLATPVALPLAAQRPAAAAREGEAGATEKVERRYLVSPTLSFRLSGSVGTVRLIGWEKDSLVVTGTVPKGVRMESAIGGDRTLPAQGAKFYLESPDDRSTASAVLEFRLPTRARAWIKSGTAHIEVSDFAGGADINVIGGSVRVSSSPRELQVEAMDASVTIDGSPPWLRAKTATGDITFRGSTRDAVVSSVSGGVRMEGGEVERARVETVSGAIVFASTIAPSADVSLDSHSGTVELRLPSRGDFEVEATSVTGTIDNRYDARRPAPGREGRGESLTLGRGNARARAGVRTFKGAIVITYR